MKMKNVLLINMPFADVETPSLALGLFKAIFNRMGIPCNVLDLNVFFAEMVGWKSYTMLTKLTSPYAGEQMFSQSLFGNGTPSDTKYYNDVINPISPGLVNRLRMMKKSVEPFFKISLERIRWQDFHIIGFTTMFEQNLASLSLAYRVKCAYPDKIIVFGGSNCEDVMGLTLHKCFPFIDFLFSGEADITFPELVKRLTRGQPIDDIPGLVYRRKNQSILVEGNHENCDLDALPFPDYDEYFHRLSLSPLSSNIKPYLMMETARGCWWGEKSKCTFCGLNGKNIKFRSKTATRALKEIKHLTKRYLRHGIQFIRLVDNVLDSHYFESLIPELSRLKLPVRFILEVRPTLKKKEIKALAEAGATYIQPGLEHLSSPTLKLMRKGSTVLHNIQILKWSKQYNVEADWNLILNTPGERPEDYEKCLEMTKVITHLKAPTSFGPFRMDRFSYNFEYADELGLTNIKPHYIYSYLYPFDEATLSDLAYHFDYENKMNLIDHDLFGLLEYQVSNWQKRNDRLIAIKNDGMVTIVDSRPVSSSPKITLNDIEGQIYEYCDEMRTLAKMKNWLENRGTFITMKKLEAVISKFMRKNLIIEENGRYLSLAVLTYPLDSELPSHHEKGKGLNQMVSTNLSQNW